jgi:hypothetical protein
LTDKIATTLLIANLAYRLGRAVELIEVIEPKDRTGAMNIFLADEVNEVNHAR